MTGYDPPHPHGPPVGSRGVIVREFCVSAVIALIFYSALLWALLYEPEKPREQLPPKVTVELSPEVRYAIQEETRKAMIEHREQMTRPILPMVAPDPKVKVKR